mgnify:CR=1 FL=1
MIISCDSKVVAGLPLGGIGAGKVEIDPAGRLINLTIMNNWSSPIREMTGFHILVMPEKGEPLFTQCNLNLMPRLSAFSSRTYLDARWPVARLVAERGGLRVEVEAMSPIIPGDPKDSSLPGIMISVKSDVRCSVAISMTNLVGASNIGRVNSEVKDGIKALNPRSSRYDHARGSMSLLTDNEVSKVVQYNVNVERNRAPRVCGLGPENEAPWEALISGADFKSEAREATGSNELPAGIVVSECGPSRPARFVMSWFFNNPSELFPYEHFYSNFFADSEDVARYMIEEFDRLRQGTIDWQERLVDPSLPGWLRDAIVNSAYILSSSSWLTKDGRFGLYEAPENGPMMNTLAGACYETGSLPVVVMFPELERSVLLQFARSQRPDGYIPHDLGTNSLDAPSDGTNAPPGWKDIPPTYILMLYRYYRRAHDVELLRELYGSAVKAYRWELQQDVDGDGLPECAGSGDTGFDCAPLAGKVSYVSSLWIAAMLALREMAKVVGDEDLVGELSANIERARRSLAATLSGGRVRAWTSGPEPDRGGLMLAQSLGDWWAYLLDLEPVISEEARNSMLDEELRVNAAASQYCTPNVVASLPWQPVYSYDQLNSSWPRLVFSVSALGYLATGSRGWLEVARKEWDNLVRQGLQWDQPSLVHCTDGRPDAKFLDHYIGSASLWSFTYKYSISRASG